MENYISKIKNFKFFIVILIFTFYIFNFSSVSAYTFLEPLPGLEQMPGESPLAKYLSWLFRFALAAAAFLAVLQITIGGIQMIFGGASETARTNARSRIWDAIWGLVLALGSVLILTTVSTQFKDMKLDIPEIKVTVTAPADMTKWTCSDPQGQFTTSAECETECLIGCTSPNPTGLPYKNASSAALNLFGVSKQSQVFLSGPETANCMDGSDPQTVIGKTLASKSIMVCSNGCNKTSGCSERTDVSLNPNMLNATAQISATVHNVTVTSLTGGSHAVNSAHYTGNAIDVVPTTKGPGDWADVVAAYKTKGAKVAECEVGGTYYAICNNIYNMPGAHIHVEF